MEKNLELPGLARKSGAESERVGVQGVEGAGSCPRLVGKDRSGVLRASFEKGEKKKPGPKIINRNCRGTSVRH